MEKTLSLSDAKARLNALVDDLHSKADEFILTKNGKPVAVLISTALYEGWKETEWIKNNPQFYKEVKKGMARLKRGGKYLSFEDIFGEKL